MSLLDNFPHKCKVYRATMTRTPGSMANRTAYDPAPVFGNDEPLECWVQNASSAEIVEWEKRNESITHRVSFRSEVAIELSDKIRITDGPGFVNKLLTVRVKPLDRTAGFGIAYTAFCEIER